ncbi:MAG TPA: formylglycine-generating enzyme family protein [Polyangiaceae bacterium]|nr:formylglycine-generating enzyme family protein [Polyangiaceae bacterium]
MLTLQSHLRSALMFGALTVVACSVDSRTLSVAYTNAPNSAGGRGPEESPSFGGSSTFDAAGDNSEPNTDDSVSIGDAGREPSDEPSTSPACVGDARERRCAVAGGSFRQGPTESAIPSHVASFQLDELEVTVARFRKYVVNYAGAPSVDAGAHPDITHSGWRSEWNALLPGTKDQLIASLHCNVDWETWTDAPGAREDYPLTCASYYVAFAFCASNGGRLPTEAEWEHAASGGAEQRRYPWGNEEPSFTLAQFSTPAIAPAGAHRAGMARFGQLDLAGSAWEWAIDYFREYPEECRQCAEVERGSERVLRGGAFLYGAEYLDPSYRYHLDPQLALGDVGFRCAYAL